MEAMKNLTVNNAKIINRNFSGRKNEYNPTGLKSFSILIDDEREAKNLANAGWHIRPMKKRNPGDRDAWCMTVKVGYNDSRYIPSIVRFENGKKTRLNENSVSILDSDVLSKVDLVIRPKYWEAGGKSGYAAYLQTLYCVATDVWDERNHQNDGNLVVHDASIIFRNFSGVVSKYNKNGERSFNLVVDDAQAAQALIADGWKLKERVNPNDEEAAPYWTLPVSLTFEHFAPVVEYYTGDNCVTLDEDTIGELDSARFEKIDLIIRPYHWELGGKSGVKAYLNRMRAYAMKDEFADEYAQYEEPVTEGEPTEEPIPW